MPQDVAATGKKVYLDYTQEELDWQYDHSKRFGDTSVFNRARAAKSAEVRKTVDGRYDVPYGPDEKERLDIFPAAAKDAPIAVFIHGGAWQRGSKTDYSFPAGLFVPRGVTFIATEFTNIPPGSLDNMVRQNRDAIAWVYRNARSFGGDPDRIHVMGHSSGGHLSGMMQVTDWKKLYGLPSDLLKGGVSLSGMFDLESIVLTYRNKYLGLGKDEARRNSPVHNIPDGYLPPLIIGCGEHDTAEFHRQPQTYIEAVREKGHEVQWIELAGRHHFAASDAYGEPGPLTDAVFAQIGV